MESDMSSGSIDGASMRSPSISTGTYTTGTAPSIGENALFGKNKQYGNRTFDPKFGQEFAESMVSPAVANFSPFQTNWNRGHRGSIGSSSFESEFNMNQLPASQVTFTHPFLAKSPSMNDYRNMDLTNQGFGTTPQLSPTATFATEVTKFQQQQEAQKQQQLLQSKDQAIEQLRTEIRQKDEALEFYKRETQNLKEALKSGPEPGPKEIPENHFKLFEKLVETKDRLQKKLSETEQHLESVLIAVSLNPQQSITDFGRYDVEDLAHKMVVKLRLLQEENSEMARMLSYGRSKQKDIEIQLLKRKVSELEKAAT